MNITVYVNAGSKRSEDINAIIDFYADLRNEIKKSNPDVVVNIEVRVD